MLPGSDVNVSCVVSSEPILSVRGLSVAYETETAAVRAVEDVSFAVYPGEFVGVVGESGSGKSTLLFAITQLLSPPARIVAGEVWFSGRDLVGLREQELRHLRWRDFSVVMQSAMNALNPVRNLGAQMRDVCKAHTRMSRREIRERSGEVLRLVGIDPIHLGSYPHQLSGGMRQRAMIAMALLFSPQLVVMDEPTSSLDVVAQRSLMIQIKRLQQQLGFSVIFVTHDMSLISRVSERLAVMYAGRIVEFGMTGSVFEHPLHPYTKGLLEAFPSIEVNRHRLTGIPGNPPNLGETPPGCRFRPRCPIAVGACGEVDPPPEEIGGNIVRCLRARERVVDAG